MTLIVGCPAPINSCLQPKKIAIASIAAWKKRFSFDLNSMTKPTSFSGLKTSWPLPSAA
ncbi:hypothetical protein PF002_g27965 [Phytophthora fragariae]|uniref:Uncharacterized protein n=1 Tax=Phytophthora fragariae TaxID=53985 RepID=A0A6A3QX94_9STRA|nr:hypothetical protein PF003_g39858 [Phytophthora fragariae]KAE9085482.1 hypothetical protein PF006_g26248 [Phytophthora fragariae]KAE9178871.1 hypothetical protein PF002_g27965 [Phytophthora fragariae]